MRPLMLDDLLNEITAGGILANQGARDKAGRKRAKKLARRAVDPQRQSYIQAVTYLRDRAKQGEYDPRTLKRGDQERANNRQISRDSVQGIIRAKKDTKQAIDNLNRAANPSAYPPKKPSKRMRWKLRKKNAQGTQTTQSNEDNDT